MSDPGTVTIPNVVGLSLLEAQAKLQAEGLRVGDLNPAASESVPKGSVCSTTPAVGTNVTLGTAVTLEVSSGPVSQVARRVSVPNVIGSSRLAAEKQLTEAGLSVGIVTSVSSASGATGVVTGTTPEAGTIVDQASSVNVEISSGPPTAAAEPSQVEVPDVVGLTRSAAEALLKSKSVTVGRVQFTPSHTVPADGVCGTDPEAGTLVSSGTTVELDVSTGPGSKWIQYIPNVLFAALAAIILALIVYIVTNGQSFLQELAKKDVARGLITFLIAVGTVGIAIILAVSTLILTEGEGGDKRFDRGKQVLTTLIGVLGTIVGFYYGSESGTGTQTRAATEGQATERKISTTSLPDGNVNAQYSATLQATGFTSPLTWTVDSKLPAGLTLDAAKGSIAGTPTEITPKKSYRFTVTDSSAQHATSWVDLDLEIRQAKP